MPEPTRDEGRVHSLTTARFFAAAWVVFFHYLSLRPGSLENVRASGVAGVSFFFVLSGFILTWNYGGSNAGAGFTRRGFWVARFARIYPVYVVAILLSLPFVVNAGVRPSFLWGSLAANLLLVQSVLPPYAMSWNTPGWTISTEAFFYLAFPFVRDRLPTRSSPGRIVAAGAACWLAGLVLPAAWLLLQPDGPNPAEGTYRPWFTLVTASPIGRIPEFLLGVCAGHFVLDQRARGVRLHGDLLVLAGMAPLAVVLASGSLPRVWLESALLAPLHLLVILGLAQGTGFLSRALSWPPLVFLGEASYAVYILQRPVRLWFMVLLGYSAVQTTDLRDFFAYFAILVGLSSFAFVAFERPARRVLRARLAPNS